MERATGHAKNYYSEKQSKRNPIFQAQAIMTTTNLK